MREVGAGPLRRLPLPARRYARRCPDQPRADSAPHPGRLTDGPGRVAGGRAGRDRHPARSGGAPRADPRRGRARCSGAGRRPRSPSRRWPTPPACRGRSSTPTSATAAACSPRSYLRIARAARPRRSGRALDPTRSPSEQLRPHRPAYLRLRPAPTARRGGVLATVGGDRAPGGPGRPPQPHREPGRLLGRRRARPGVAARTRHRLLEAASDEDDTDSRRSIPTVLIDVVLPQSSADGLERAGVGRGRPQGLTASDRRSRRPSNRCDRARRSPVTLDPASRPGGPGGRAGSSTGGPLRTHLGPVVRAGRVAAAAGPLELAPAGRRTRPRSRRKRRLEPSAAQTASSRSGRSVRGSRPLARRTSSWWTATR